MVYGLLGLVNDNLGIQPVYLKGNFEDVDRPETAIAYISTAKKLIEFGNVDVLVFAQPLKKDMELPSWVPDWRSQLRQSFSHGSGIQVVDYTAVSIAQYMEKHAGLPSWVPNWRCEINRSFAWLRDEEKKPLFKASANLEVELVEEENDRVLAIMRYKVDEVEEVRGPWNVDVTGETYRFPHETYINYLSQVGQFCLISKAKDANIYRDSERRDETVWWVPVGDLEQDETFLPVRATPRWKKASSQR